MKTTPLLLAVYWLFAVTPTTIWRRPEKEGGQRWFHLYPDQKIGPDSPLYWTRLSRSIRSILFAP